MVINIGSHPCERCVGGYILRYVLGLNLVEGIIIRMGQIKIIPTILL